MPIPAKVKEFAWQAIYAFFNCNLPTIVFFATPTLYLLCDLYCLDYSAHNALELAKEKVYWLAFLYVFYRIATEPKSAWL